VTVERPASSRVDDVPNKLTERQWTAVFRRAVLASDVRGDSPKVRVVSAKKTNNAVTVVLCFADSAPAPLS